MKTLHTDLQYQIKDAYGVWDGCTVRTRFHWRFWAPLRVQGGLVYFGTYKEVDMPDHVANRRFGE